MYNKIPKNQQLADNEFTIENIMVNNISEIVIVKLLN